MMEFRKLAIEIIKEVLKWVYPNSNQSLEKIIEKKLKNLTEEINPALKEKDKEIETLRKALAYTYDPTREEYSSFDDHCRLFLNAGSCPPEEDEYWAEIALEKYKQFLERERLYEERNQD